MVSGEEIKKKSFGLGALLCFCFSTVEFFFPKNVWMGAQFIKWFKEKKKKKKGAALIEAGTLGAKPAISPHTHSARPFAQWLWGFLEHFWKSHSVHALRMLEDTEEWEPGFSSQTTLVWVWPRCLLVVWFGISYFNFPSLLFIICKMGDSKYRMAVRVETEKTSQALSTVLSI